MLIYIRRKYREESRLPLDMKHPRPDIDITPFWDFARSEVFTVKKEHRYLEPNPFFFKLSEITQNLYYYKFKKEMLRRVPAGTIIALVLASKMFHGAPASHENPVHAFSPIYRVFYGHCIWKRKSVLLLRMYLVRTLFLLRVNLYAPNVVAVMCITHPLMRRNERSSFFFKVRDYRRRKLLSRKNKQR
jgi:hypothetical protein